MSFSLTEDDQDIEIRLPEDCSSKTHTITDFRCDECGKYFSASRSLILHKKIHTGIRPFTCPVEGCGKSFYVNAQLVRHSFSHSNIRTEKCPFEHCTSPIKLFKTKADVKQHIKNWHTLEKSEQRELKLLRKLEKYKKFAENYKKLREQNKMLSDELRKLKQTLEAHQEVSLPVSQPDDSLRRPVPPFTQFLREQYESFRSKGVKLPFIECSKRISKTWRTMSEESKKPYLERFRLEMEEQ
ncbi:uncharacterized protein [Blastocystis hominis]|uniref:HMG box domain-containing protein n=1 Tax=Blastocystis hominis TaxID=12968 RepID=D8LZ21_BLAHO|nr:uncharacterized protein [Blastocystis hominis]CBK21060.2 unnamed protein product [Blastocystis hominis]|eukprot:XP_012895108.1 uncharacterized protein [Blastocystis hominis]